MANFFDQFDSRGSPAAGAISGIESGGNYRAIGPETGKGRALGKYQVMDFNVGPWSREVLGREVTPQEFIATPQIQDAIFNAKFGQYEKKYGPEGAARAWFAGEGGMNDPNRKDVLGTTVSAYADKFNRAYGAQQPTDMSSQSAGRDIRVRPVGSAAPQESGNFFDQFDTQPAEPRATVAERSDMGALPPDAALHAGLERRAASMRSPEKSMLTSARETLGDATSGLAQGLTFGFGDELLAAGMTVPEMISGAVSGEDTGKGVGGRISDSYGRALQKNRDLDKTASTRSPIASTAAEIVGGVTSGGGLAKGGVTLLNAAKPTYKSMIGRGAAEGAAYGAVHGFGTGEGLENRIQKAGAGLATGALTGGAVGAVAGRSASRAASRNVMTADDLKAAANQVYDAADNLGVVVQPTSYQALVQRLYSRLVNEGVDPTLHPGVLSAFKRLEELQNQPVSFKTLDIIRRVANSAGKSIQNRDEGRLAGIMVDEIDKLMNGLRPTDVVQGNGAAAGKLIQEARNLWSRARKSETLENVVERAMDRVGANYTSAGFQTAIRQEVKALLKNGGRGFSKAEVGMMRDLVRGASVQNILRHIGKLAPRGVVGATLGGGVGYTLGGPAGAAAIWGVGEGAKRASSAMTQRNLNGLIEFVRRGGPRVLQKLPAKQRAMLDAAIAGGQVTMEQLGLAPASPQPSGIMAQ